MLARNTNSAFLTRDARDAFLLGNQGPDPLFFATLTSRLVKNKVLGVQMHREHIEEYLGVWRSMINNLKIKTYNLDVMQAYVNGFLCHYALDKTAHPFVDAYKEAILHAGVKGLDPSDGSYVHAQIEADLDVYLLYKLTGRTMSEYDVPKQMLYANDAVLGSVDDLYRVAARVYQLQVPQGVFVRSIKDMRIAVQLMYSPGGTKRALLGVLERTFRPHSLLQAMSHRPEAYKDNWYANEEHMTWCCPGTDNASTSSYYELFVNALNKATAYMELFRDGASLTDITEGLDFYGKNEQSDKKD